MIAHFASTVGGRCSLPVLGGDRHANVLAEVRIVVVQLVAGDAVTPQLAEWLHPRQLDGVG